MPKYFYKAKSLKGEREEGTLEAKNKSELAKILRKEGLILISAEEEKLKKAAKIEFPIFKGVPLVEKMMFTRNLKVMISAGIALPRALEILSQQTKSKKFRNCLLEIKEEILKGKNFSDGLSEHPEIFPELFSSMVKVGEEGGRLEEVLGILTRQMEREHDLRSKIKGAMMYPAVIVLAMIAIGALMLLVVIPKISATFKELEIPLPPTTRFVIWLGGTLASRWYLVLFLLFSLPFLVKYFSKTKTGKKIIDNLSLKLPIVSSITKKTNSAYTARTLSSLISSGVPFAKSLEIVSGTLGNIYYREAMKVAAENLRKGRKLSEILSDYKKIYPILVIQMVAVGEETGQTSEILEKLADFFEEEVTNATKNLASVIEPIVMLLIGGVIGFFAVSMIQPMYSMLGAIR